MGFEQRLDVLLPPSLRAGRSVELRRARVAVRVILLMLIADVLLGGFRFMSGHRVPLAIPAALAFIGLLVLLRVTGNVRLLAHSISFLLTFSVLALTILSGGVGSVAMSAFVLVPLFGTYLGGIRCGAAWSVVAALAVVGFKWMEVANVPWPVEVDPGRVFPVTGTLLMMGGVVAIGWAYDSSRERDERALLRREEELRSLVAALPHAVIRLDPEGRCVECHPGRIAAPVPASAVGRPFAAYFDSPELSVAIARSRTEDVELDIAHEGRAWAFHLLPHPSGGSLVIARDDTDLRAIETDLSQAKLQAVLERADRMSSLGMLAAGMAHEINNPLAYLSGNLAYLAEQLAEGEAIDALSDARVAVERIRRIVSDLKLYARDHEDDEVPNLVLLPDVTDAAIKLAHTELSHRARIETEHRAAPPVLASEGRLVQVVLNLLVNAAQALPPGRAADHVVTVRTFAENGRSMISVTDTGPGIPAAILGKVTQPFFTSKPVGLGTGLGLSVCDGIVRQYDGDLQIDTVEGQGTTVTVALPSARTTPSLRASCAPALEPLERAGRILVVDDEPLVRRALRRLLRRHEIVEADSGARAIEILGADRRFDVILCDVMMPESTGLEFYEHLLTASPELRDRLVFMTGGTFDDQVQGLFHSMRGAPPIIQKPFQPHELREVLADRLGLESDPPPP